VGGGGGGGFYDFGVTGVWGGEGSMTCGCRGMAGGGSRPGGGGGVWAARSGGDGAADQVVEDFRWAGQATEVKAV
jgi:hypothetical protein